MHNLTGLKYLMKALKIFLFFSLCSICIFAQNDSISLAKFEKLKPNDELIIEYANYGCNNSSGDRLVISTDKEDIRVIRFKNFQIKRTLDGEVLTGIEKQNLMTQTNEFKSKIISFKEFQKLLRELEIIINCGNDDGSPIIAGAKSELTIKLNKLKIKKEYRRFIELKSIEGIF